jgi:uncharacterized protein YjiS (DUF1127 family)
MTGTATATHTVPSTFAKFNPIQWLLHMDAVYREADRLKKTGDRLLEDAGVSRKQVDTVFYQRFGQNRYYSK